MNLQAYLRETTSSASAKSSSASDIALALVIVATIALMLLPLPTVLIDVLVAINIAVALMLVLMSIYISTAVQFSAFPSILLISTLFRLALSVATTRMILLQGDAGNIIDTFGNLVVGGNLIVGLVVFLIITVVQFLVIAKGAERVAEVGARFTLDAMPGKQLSIDADLRSGLIDANEAKQLRRELEQESKLHGSMDGAMKFVKGDAIAGIVIILVNLVGGLSIGIFQLQMQAGAAVSKYSILTIGDGLVAQVPALLGAMAAGLIVTRATDSRNDRHLGDSIQKQFSAKPRVLLVAGAFCIVLALVPGFPSLVFSLIGFLLLVAGALVIPGIRSRLIQPLAKGVDKHDIQPATLGTVEADQVYQSVPLLLELPKVFAQSEDTVLIRERVTQCVNEYQMTSGIAMPVIQIHYRRDDSAEWLLHAFEVPIAQDVLHENSSIDDIILRIHTALRKNGTLFLGIQETGQLLNIASNGYPDIVKEAMRSIPTQNIAAILRNLVSEEVSIRNMRGILEALVEASQHEKDVHNLTEFARIALARQTCYQYAPSNTLNAVALSPQLEDQLSKHVRIVGGVQQFDIDPHSAKRLRASVLETIDTHSPYALLTSVRLRRHLRSLIAKDRFDVPVLSYNELVDSLELNVLHQLVLDEHTQLSSVN